MRVDFSDILATDPVSLLLEKSPPHIHLRLLTDVFGRSSESRSVEELREECGKSQGVRRILQHQNDGGTWDPKQSFTQEYQQQGVQYFHQILQLHTLADLGATREIPGVQDGIVALMKMQHPDGKFPLFYQHQGYALWVLMRYGLQGNPFLDRGVRWLLKRQRDDYGWLHMVQVPRGEDRQSYPSCIWTTCHALLPMVHHNVYVNKAQVTAGVEYLLDHLLDTNHTSFFNSPDAWDYLYIGHDESGCFRGGTLKVLEIAVAAGFDRSHSVVRKTADWLRDQQLESGLFPAIAGKDTGGDLMVTIRALAVLRKLYPENVVIRR